ncbi:MAG: DUF4011 domain-containing protein [Geobacter sp.]|nr:DUF4011 domain-containing protein [Geobacter sp.]
MSDFVNNALARVRSKLLDLTRRNRLLNYKESARSIRVVDELPDEVFRILVQDEKEMQFLPVQDEGAVVQGELDLKHELPQQNGTVAVRHRDTRLQTPFGANVLERRCKKLLQESRTAIEETGSNLLHLAIGFLEWYEAEESAELNRAPLILVPVRIDRSRIDPASNCYTYVISYTGEDIETNLSLAEKLNCDFDLILPSLDEDVSPEGYFEAVAATVGRRSGWRVAREMVLGLFSFSKLLMYKDLDHARWPDETSPINHPNISCILGGRCDELPGEEQPYGEEYDIDRDSRAISLPLVTDADSSQTSVIIDAVHHRENLVVEGPPGTGKSQTITNMIAAALHQGLSVLFVSEKKAALEVVRSRLDHSGLGDFCLELHSHKTQKGQLHADIGRRLKKSFPDVRTLDHEIEDLARERDRLMAYSNLMNSVVGPNDETIYDIFWAAERCRTEVRGQPPRFSVTNALALTRDQLSERVNLLRDVARLRQDLPDEAIWAWQDFTPGTVLPGDDEVVTELLDELTALVERYQGYLDGVPTANSWPVPFSIRALRRLRLADGAVLAGLPADFHQVLALALVQPESMVILEELAAAIVEHRQLTTAAAELVDHVDGEVSPALAHQIAAAADELKEIGYGGGTPSRLAELAEGQKKGCEQLLRIAEAVHSVKTCFASPLLSIDDCRRLTELQRVLAALPAELAGQWHAEHALEATASAFLDARNVCEQLVACLNEHGRFFLLRYLPDHIELAKLARELRGFRGSFFAFLSSRYRTLRRTVKALLTDSKQVSAPHLIERLEGLIDTLATIAEVRSNEAYRHKLGPLYVGVETDWGKLEESVSWGQKFATAVGSQSHAHTLAPRLTELAPAVATAAALTASANSELASLREPLGLSCTTRISDVQAKLTHDRERLLALLQPINAHQRLASFDIASLSAAAQAFLEAHRLATTLDEKRYQQLLGVEYAGMATDIDRLLRSARWLAGVREQGNFADEVVAWLAATDTIARRDLLVDILEVNRVFWDSFPSLFARLSNYGMFVPDSLFHGEEHDCPLTALAEAATKCREQVRYLVTWGDYRRTLARADGLDLGVVTEAIDCERIAPNESAAIYRHAVYDCMAREIIARHPELAGFTRAEFEGVRERYATTDRQIMKNTRGRIAHIASSRPVPRGVAYGPVKTHTDLALVERELAKQKRHIPIRQLVRRAGRALQGLKPCFMMSPLSVAQYLEPGLVNFDLVVMDEASQLKPEDALGAICRAKQLIVVGDPHQLPPTSFFDRTDGGGEIEDDEAAAVQDTESILDICMTTYRKRRLRWHYRSEHESLIAFSNNRFYDNDLIIFPSPLGKHRDYGVHRHYIEGAAYQKGRNRLEAEAVAQAVIAHFRNTPALSLGVATFNREQAELVLDILDRLQKEQPWLEQALKKTEQTEEPFFVKNLENVQGDERDVIFVATTYGPDQTTGKVYQRFGPIAGDTGWRRLNVIFTRAKKRLELFTSLRSADIKLGDNPSKGALALKQYLGYAETGLLPDYGTIGGREPDSDFEVAVAHHLHCNGFMTVAQVGVAGFFIDIGVLHQEREGEFVLGIECDGAAYHSSKSVRDRDRLRQEILERKGWRIHRIWSTDWFKNRDREIHRLLAAVRQAVEAHASVAGPAPGFQEAVAAAISSLHTESKPKVPTTTEPTPAAAAATAKTAKGLREELIEYRQANILPSFTDEGRGILRDEILDRLVKQMPITREEFYAAVPMELRQHTDGKQMQFLDDILEIVDAYT